MALLHVSINANDPKSVSFVLAQVLGGKAMPFPPFPDSWIAFTERDDGTAIEVYPLEHRLEAGEGQVECVQREKDNGSTFAHIALATPMTTNEILEIGEEHGWTCRLCNRGPFECIELWLENRFLIEILTPQMQAQYRANMKMSDWSAMFGGFD